MNYDEVEIYDSRRNTQCDEHIKQLYLRQYNGYQIHKILLANGCKISIQTVYSRLRELKDNTAN